MSLAFWLNRAWMWKCAGAVQRFARMTRRVAATQQRVLRSIVSPNRNTAFGRAHGFSRICGPRDFQARVPLSSYGDYEEPLRRIAAGEPNVLTREPVLLLEPTSGSTGGEKLIPFTATLRRQFAQALGPWIGDLFRHRPGVRAGRAYWSISPAFGPPRRSVGGIPIGFDDDTAYLGGLERIAMRHILAVPSNVARVANIDAFRYLTLRYLLQAGDLSLISVWSPTFLTALLRPLAEWGEQLCADLRTGRAANGAIPPDPRRAAKLESILRVVKQPAERLAAIWPHLALISCWTDAAAGMYVDDLRALFPHVEIQPKGLLATEGVVSFPLVGHPGTALALGSHFFEFQEIGANARCRLAHELEGGGHYRVVLTTGGGLYRYQLRDEVEIVGFAEQCPLLRFLGKADRVSDLVGEKLAEPFVQAALERCFVLGGRPRFVLLVPMVGQPSHYRLYIQGGGFAGEEAALAERLQRELEANPHYRYAVNIGQLGRLKVERLDPDGARAESLIERHHLSRGRKAGAIKPTVFDTWTGWPEVFAGLAPLPSQL